MHTAQMDEALTIPLGGTPAPAPDTPLVREVDEFCAMQTLYLLDRFGVSDEFDHELTQVYMYSRNKDYVYIFYYTALGISKLTAQLRH